jgi:LPPG:FO 2-phospho-L-lactate transferase
MNNSNDQYLALSGGVGGAKLALGLDHILQSGQLSIVANTADDFNYLGFYVSPDIDTLLYTLSGLNDKEKGWGRADESWNFMAACKDLGVETWFQLGDKDLSLHVFRSQGFKQGLSLTEITQALSERLQIKSTIIPMSDDPVRTMVNSNIGRLSFQEYFVKHCCTPEVRSIEFEGINNAKSSAKFDASLRDHNLKAIIVCPSNPFLSIESILSLQKIRQRIKDSSAPVIIVSPIVCGEAIKGPTTKIMQELNMVCDVRTIAEFYADIADGMIIDTKDTEFIEDIEAKGIKVHTTNIIMNSLQDRIDLADAVVRFSKRIV